MPSHGVAVNNRPYQIANWDSSFESEKSRKVARCSFVCLPNKRGVGLTHLLAMKDGHTFFSMFVLLAEACSRQSKPRHGWMTENGRGAGRPWDANDIAAIVALEEKTVVAGLKALSSPRVGWLQQVDPVEAENTAAPTSAGGRGVRGKRVDEPVKSGEIAEKPVERPANKLANPAIDRGNPANDGRSKKERRKEEKKSTSSCPEPARAASGPEHAGAGKSGRSDPVILTFPIVPRRKGDDAEWPLRRSLVRELDDAFSTIDVTAEARKALAWVKANPTKRKTAGGMQKFLTNWMNRATNGNGVRRGAASQADEADFEIEDPTLEQAMQTMRDLGLITDKPEVPVV